VWSTTKVLAWLWFSWSVAGGQEGFAPCTGGRKSCWWCCDFFGNRVATQVGWLLWQHLEVLQGCDQGLPRLPRVRRYHGIATDWFVSSYFVDCDDARAFFHCKPNLADKPVKTASQAFTAILNNSPSKSSESRGLPFSRPWHALRTSASDGTRGEGGAEWEGCLQK